MKSREDVSRHERLTALMMAAVERLEDRHDGLVRMMPDDPAAQRKSMLELRRLGVDLLILGQAGLILLRD
jgi:hypothetical protein